MICVTLLNLEPKSCQNTSNLEEKCDKTWKKENKNLVVNVLPKNEVKKILNISTLTTYPHTLSNVHREHFFTINPILRGISELRELAGGLILPPPYYIGNYT